MKVNGIQINNLLQATSVRFVIPEKTICQLVQRFKGLTEEEIKIVENN